MGSAAQPVASSYERSFSSMTSMASNSFGVTCYIVIVIVIVVMASPSCVAFALSMYSAACLDHLST